MAAPAYQALASVYDETIGWPAFHRIRSLFEQLVRRLNLRFRDAADLGCGTGLFCRYLATRWRVPVTGVDLSPDMLRIAAWNCRGLPVRLIRGDIARLQLPSPVDLISCNFDTLNHLPGAEAARSAVFRASRNLRPGGVFFLDFLTPCQRFPPGRTMIVRRQARRRRMTQVLRWEPGRRVMSVTVVMDNPSSGRRTVERHLECLYPACQVGTWMRECGLHPVAVLDAEARIPRTPGADCTPRVFILARRI